MKSNIEPLFPYTFYHIYNRGINGETIFKKEENYAYFLQRYAFFIPPVAETYAYCLLGNHFHLLVRIRSEKEILEFANKKVTANNADRVQNPVSVNDPISKRERTVDQLISLQFSHFFNSYAQAFNKQNDRTGGLFETPFRRKQITSESYLSQVIFYIHSNPQKHGFCDDFRDYPYSSYHAHLSSKPTKLAREEVLQSFGGEGYYRDFHKARHDTKEIDRWAIEFD